MNFFHGLRKIVTGFDAGSKMSDQNSGRCVKKEGKQPKNQKKEATNNQSIEARKTVKVSKEGKTTKVSKEGVLQSTGASMNKSHHSRISPGRICLPVTKL